MTEAAGSVSHDDTGVAIPRPPALGIAGVSVAVAALVYWMVSTGLLHGLVGLAALCLLLCATPTAPTLSRRLAINGAVLIGWSPVLWMVRWPFPINHGALLMAGWSGVLGMWVLSGLRDKPVTRLIPAIRPEDAFLLPASAAAILMMKNWWGAANPARALAVLLPGWDNYAHFGMFALLRANGALAGGTAQDSSPWAFRDYPRGFHAFVATLSELTQPTMGTRSDLLTSYTSMVAVAVLLGTLVLTGFVVSIPGLGERLEVLAPTLVLIWAAFLWEPGQWALADGFANFWMACAAAGAVLIAVLSGPQGLSIAQVASVTGLLLAVSENWAPLLLLASPTAVLLVRQLFDAPRHLGRWRTLFLWGVSAIGLALCALALVNVLTTVPVGHVVTATGGMHGPAPAPILVLAIISPYVCLSFPGWIKRRRDKADDTSFLVHRVRVLALAPCIGLLSLSALLTAQLALTGTSAYYFLKYSIGFELILTVVTAGVAGLLIAQTTGPPRVRTRFVLVGLVGVMLASQAFGGFPQKVPPMWSESGKGTAPVSAPYSRLAIARGILLAADGVTPRTALYRDYVATGAGRVPQYDLANLWFHGVSQSMSQGVTTRSLTLQSQGNSTHQVLEVIRRLLDEDPAVVVIVSPAELGRVRRMLDSPALARRVSSW